MRQSIRLTEGQLHRIIEESVRKVINEIGNTKYGSYMLGRAAGRNERASDYPSVIDKQNRASDQTYFFRGYNDQRWYDTTDDDGKKYIDFSKYGER